MNPNPEEKFLDAIKFYQENNNENYKDILLRIAPEDHLEIKLCHYLDDLSNRELNIKVEYSKFLMYCCSMKVTLENDLESTEDKDCSIMLDRINNLLSDKQLNDNLIEQFILKYNIYFTRIYGKDFINNIPSEHKEINHYLDNLENEIEENKDHFIMQFNKIALGNFIKTFYNAEILSYFINETINDCSLLKTHIKKPNGITNTQLIRDTLNDFKAETLPENELDVFDMEPMELLDLKIGLAGSGAGFNQVRTS